MNMQVKVKANEDGSLITTSANNTEYGWIRLEQERFVLGSWAQNKTVSALMMGTMENLQLIVNSLKLENGSTVPGQIVTKMSHEHFYEGQGMHCYGDSGIPCLKDGQPIYRQTFYTQDLTETDELIAWNNQDDYRNHVQQAQPSKNIEPSAIEDVFDVDSDDSNDLLSSEVEETIEFEL